MLARQYRNAAEECRSKQSDKVVEGSSRSGKILRAALIRNSWHKHMSYIIITWDTYQSCQPYEFFRIFTDFLFPVR